MLRLEVREQGFDGLNIKGRMDGVVGRHRACYYWKGLNGRQPRMPQSIRRVACPVLRESFFSPPTGICPCGAQDPLQPLMAPVVVPEAA